MPDLPAPETTAITPGPAAVPPLTQLLVGQLREQRVARVALAIGLLLLGLYILDSFLRALAWAAVLAVATWPLYLRAQRLHARPAISPDGHKARGHNILLPLLFTVVTTLVVLVPLVLLGMQVGHEARSIAAWVADARQHGIPLPQALTNLPLGQAQVSGWWDENLGNPEGAQTTLGRLDTRAMQFGRSYGSRILHTAVNFVFTLLALFFLYRDGPELSGHLLEQSRRLFGPSGERVARQLVASIHGTVDGLVLVGLGVGLVLGIGYAVAGIPHPVLLGAATAIGAMLPLGATIVLAIACLLALAAGNTVAASILAAFGLVVVFVADHFIRPALIGGATKLPFLWVLLGILGGVETFGILGLFVGPAVMAALILLWREWLGDARTSA